MTNNSSKWTTTSHLNSLLMEHKRHDVINTCKGNQLVNELAKSTEKAKAWRITSQWLSYHLHSRERCRIAIAMQFSRNFHLLHNRVLANWLLNETIYKPKWQINYIFIIHWRMSQKLNYSSTVLFDISRWW